jgi:hexokinase
MKASSERKDKFTYSKVPQQSNFYDDSQGGQQSEKKEFLALDLGGTSMQQMELIESQVIY